MSQSTTALHRPRRAVRSILAITATLTVVIGIVVAGGGTTFALWNSSVVVGAGSLSSGTVSVAQQGFEALSTAYAPDALSTAAAVTITNTGSSPFDYTAAFRLVGGSSAPLAAAISVSIWEIGSAVECTASATPGLGSTGTWATPPAVTDHLVPGAAQLYCLRSTLPANALDTAPRANVTEELAVTAAIGGWSAVATASATQETPDRPNIGCTQQGSITTLDWLNPQSSNYSLYVNGVELAKNKKASSPYELTIDELVAAGVISPGVVTVELRKLGQGSVLYSRTITLVQVGAQLEVRC